MRPGSMVANVQPSTGMILQWSVLTFMWLLFVFQLPMSELLAGAAGAALSVLVLHAGLRAVPLCFEPRLRWLAQARRLPGMIVGDMGYLLRDPQSGTFCGARFRVSFCSGVSTQAPIAAELHSALWRFCS